MNDEVRRQELIESRIDQERSSGIAVSSDIGGIKIENMVQVFEISKMMAVAGPAIPKHLRNNPGACFAICIQSLEWHMSPFSVANKSYVVNDRIAYEAQLIAALVMERAPLAENEFIDYSFDGSGPSLSCTVSAKMKGGKTLTYKSPIFSEIKTKNSPLWVTDPQQQLGYYSIRAWARRHVPNVLLGIYTPDEMAEEHVGAENAKDVTPSANDSLHHRLSAKAVVGAGFNAGGINAAINGQADRTEPTNAGPIISEPAAAADLGSSPPSPEAAAATVVSDGAASEDDREHPSEAKEQARVVEADTVEPGADVGAKPTPAPAVPTDGKDYPAYARAVLATLMTEVDVKKFWRDGVKLRNALPNFTGALAEEAEEAKAARLAEIK